MRPPSRFRFREAMSLISRDAETRFATVFERHSLKVEIYAPRGVDPQEPHLQDEIYVVISGRGWFTNGGQRHPFEPGDLLFVPAGVEHRFEEFTDDLMVWVIFYGPEGGEATGFAASPA